MKLIWLLAYRRTTKELISVILNYQVCGNLLQQPWETNALCTWITIQVMIFLVKYFSLLEILLFQNQLGMYWVLLSGESYCPLLREGKIGHNLFLSDRAIFFKRLHLFIFRVRGTEGERETSMCGCLSCAPYWGPGLQPRRVPLLQNRMGWGRVNDLLLLKGPPLSPFCSRGLPPHTRFTLPAARGKTVSQCQRLVKRKGIIYLKSYTDLE